MEVIKQNDPNLMHENENHLINSRDTKKLEDDFDQSNKNYSNEVKLFSTSLATAYIGNQIKSTTIMCSINDSHVEKNDNKNSELNLNNQIFQDPRFTSKTETCMYSKTSSITNQTTSLTNQASKNIETNETVLSSHSRRNLEISVKNRNKPKTSKEILQEIARLTNGTTPSYLLKKNKEQFDLKFK
jgi:hypothetical protein